MHAQGRADQNKLLVWKRMTVTRRTEMTTETRRLKCNQGSKGTSGPSGPATEFEGPWTGSEPGGWSA
jgi:hypothetical protein